MLSNGKDEAVTKTITATTNETVNPRLSTTDQEQSPSDDENWKVVSYHDTLIPNEHKSDTISNIHHVINVVKIKQMLKIMMMVGIKLGRNLERRRKKRKNL